jgi:hypothetical protein
MAQKERNRVSEKCSVSPPSSQPYSEGNPALRTAVISSSESPFSLPRPPPHPSSSPFPSPSHSCACSESHHPKSPLQSQPSEASHRRSRVVSVPELRGRYPTIASPSPGSRPPACSSSSPPPTNPRHGIPLSVASADPRPARPTPRASPPGPAGCPCHAMPAESVTARLDGFWHGQGGSGLGLSHGICGP